MLVGSEKQEYTYVRLLIKERRGKMLFMSIFTVEPGKAMEVIRRRAEKGPMTGGKIIGKWAAIEGSRVFRVVEVDDPKAVLTSVMSWSDLGKTEIVPIFPTEEVIKLPLNKKWSYDKTAKKMSSGL
jgi:hypothetical protein